MFILRMIGLLCRHKAGSVPFTLEGRTYRRCMKCGARQDYDAATLRPVGGFYQD